jgi:hypothetical protein
MARTLPADELPGFLGELEQVRAVAWARLASPSPGNGQGQTPAQVQENSAEVLDVKQAAEHIHMSVRWVYQHHQILPTIKMGFGRLPRLRFRRQDLDAWLQKRAT